MISRYSRTLSYLKKNPKSNNGLLFSKHTSWVETSRCSTHVRSFARQEHLPQLNPAIHDMSRSAGAQIGQVGDLFSGFMRYRPTIAHQANYCASNPHMKTLLPTADRIRVRASAETLPQVQPHVNTQQPSSTLPAPEPAERMHIDRAIMETC